jgi:hypothetical protein
VLLLWCADVEKFYQQCDPGEAPRLHLRLVHFVKFNWAACTALCVFRDTPIPCSAASGWSSIWLSSRVLLSS